MRRWARLLATCVALWPAAASAGGLEYAGAGTLGLGRAGATGARADDPLVLMNNPAGLAELQGHQLLLSLNLADMRMCVKPAGYYGWGAYRGGQPFELRDPDTGEVTRYNLGVPEQVGDREQAYYEDPLDTVCGRNYPTPIPQLVWAGRVSRRLGVGFGFLFPSAQPSARWSESADGVIHGDAGDLRPSPVRYMMLRSGNLALFPSIGAGYRVSEVLRVGLMLQWGIVSLNQTLMTATSGGTAPHHDVLTQVTGEDYFVPAATASVHLVPDDAWDFVLTYKYQDAVDASGELDVTTSLFSPQSDIPTSGVPYTQKDLVIRHIQQEMPDKLLFAMRYSDRLAPRPTGTGLSPQDPATFVIHDPLQDERWDLELDVEYFFTSENDKTVVVPKPGQFVEFKSRQGDLIAAQDTEIPRTQVVRNWRDQWSLRLGGSYHVLPGRFGVSAGVHYETRAVDPTYMSIDFWPLQRLGLHSGLIFRLWSRIDITLSYAHIFQETLVVAPPEHGGRVSGGFDKSVGTQGFDRAETLPVLEEAPLSNVDGVAGLRQNLTKTARGDPAWIMNSGTYTSGFDVVGVGVLVHY